MFVDNGAVNLCPMLRSQGWRGYVKSDRMNSKTSRLRVAHHPIYQAAFHSHAKLSRSTTLVPARAALTRGVTANVEAQHVRRAIMQSYPV